MCDSRGTPIICIVFLDLALLSVSSTRRAFHPVSNSENLEMGTNGKDISCERFPKKSGKIQNPQSEPFKPKFKEEIQIRTIITGKILPKKWKNSRKSQNFGISEKRTVQPQNSGNSGMKII